jgi:uncharacterized membrane protein YkvA (DUF1232 family)
MVLNRDAMKVPVAAACHDPPMDLGWLPAALIGLALLWVALLGLFWVLRPRDVPIRELLRIVPDVLRLLRALIRDPAVPLDARLVLVGLVAWILSPIDLIPEFVPGLGPLDDVIVAVVAMRYVRRRVGVIGISSRWAGSDDGLRLLLRVIGG